MTETTVLQIGYITSVTEKLTIIHFHCHLCSSLRNVLEASCVKPVSILQDKRTAPSLDRFYFGLNTLTRIGGFILLIHFAHTTHILTTPLSVTPSSVTSPLLQDT